jgi:hypothetical protein
MCVSEFLPKKTAKAEEDCVESLLVHQSFNFFYFLFSFSVTFSAQRYHHRKKKKSAQKKKTNESEKNEQKTVCRFFEDLTHTLILLLFLSFLHPYISKRRSR